MAQKSLSIINKSNVSLIHYITYFNKYFKWLSLQNFYFLLFFNKYCEFLNFIINKSLWVVFHSKNFYVFKKIINKFFFTQSLKFHYNASYLVYIDKKVLLINLYYYNSIKEENNLYFLKRSINIESFYLNGHKKI